MKEEGREQVREGKWRNEEKEEGATVYRKEIPFVLQFTCILSEGQSYEEWKLQSLNWLGLNPCSSS